jgi:acyl-CoA synthetase (AMP-forming)/AMP-acid ligase II
MGFIKESRTMQSRVGSHAKGASLVSLLCERQQQSPEAIAFTYLQDGEGEGQRLSYLELHQAACAIAAELQDRAAQQERVLLIFGPGLDFIVSFFACLYAGKTAVPMYVPPRQQKLDRLRWVMADSESTLLLSTESTRQEIGQLAAGETTPLDVTWIEGGASRFQERCSWLPNNPRRDQIAFLQYSSGSTSDPKAVMVSHANIMANEQAICAAFRLNTDTAAVSWLPHYHDMGLIGTILQPVYYGIPCTLMSPLHFIQKPIRWLRAISENRATISGGPDFAYELCVNKVKPEQLPELDLSSWQVAFTGAEMIRAKTLDRFAEYFAPCGFDPKAFYPCYGLAESTLFVSGLQPGQALQTLSVDPEHLRQNRVVQVKDPQSSSVQLVGCGSSWFDHEIRIVDPESQRLCPDGVIGEIWLRGPSVTQGYWRKPELNQEMFHATLAGDQPGDGQGPYLRSGDLGFFYAANLYITGRLKDLIIIRGQNHFPHDIEQTVSASSTALLANGAAAFSIEQEGEERLIVVQEVERSCIRNLDEDVHLNEIRRRILLHHSLSVYAIALLKPRSIPRTSSGKIRRSHCRQQFLDGTLEPLTLWIERSGASP